MSTTAELICNACKEQTSTDPAAIFKIVADRDFVKMHGPEHHVLDGACILTAVKNTGYDLDLEAGYAWMMEQGAKMPGAACAHWGVCGAVTSIGAALSFIDKTGPLSTDGTWGKHMLFTSKALQKIGEINGPRCCKRDAFASFEEAVSFIQSEYGIPLTGSRMECGFSARNQQCLGVKCPYHK